MHQKLTTKSVAKICRRWQRRYARKGWRPEDDSGEAAGRADHRDPLEHRCDRPDQANRDHNGNTDPYSHLHFSRRVELGGIGLAYFSALQCEVVHT
jgi:hypothetical protein